MPKLRASTKKVIKDLREWLSRQRDQLRKDAVDRLEAYLEGQRPVYGVTNDLKVLELWHSSAGVATLLDGDPGGSSELQRAHDAGVLLFWTKAAQFDGIAARGVVQNPGWIPLNDIALRIARALILCRLECAGGLARRSKSGFDDGLLSLTDVTRLGPFMLRLVADLERQPDPITDKIDVLREPVYDELLANWRVSDPSNVQSIVDSMCELHRARSGEPDNKEWYEFSWYHEFLWPAEILAVFRLREQRGLENPEIREPYFPEALRRLPPIVPRVEDSLLVRIRAKLEQELGKSLPPA